METIDTISSDPGLVKILMTGVSVLSLAVNVLFYQLMKSKSNEVKYLRKKFDEVQSFLMENAK